MNYDLTILVNSCDKYEDAWKPFFDLFHMQWPNCPYNMILNAETKKYISNNRNIKTHNSCGEWSKRVISALLSIESEYVLFMLEDFFLMSEINLGVLNTAIGCMRTEKVGGVIFVPEMDYEYWPVEGCYFGLFSAISKDAPLRVMAVIGLWKREYLLSLLRPWENAWEFEKMATIRAKRDDYLILCPNKECPVAFNYHVDVDYGYGISAGKWLPNNKELFKKYGIEVDYNNLGIYDYEVDYPKRYKAMPFSPMFDFLFGH